MARKAFHERRKAVVDAIARMLVNYLETKVFADKSRDEICRRTGINQSVMGVTWWADIPEICEGTGLDIGLTVRDSKGHEVTFWPPMNFAHGGQLPKIAPAKPPSVEVVRIGPAGVHRHFSTGEDD